MYNTPRRLLFAASLSYEIEMVLIPNQSAIFVSGDCPIGAPLNRLGYDIFLQPILKSGGQSEFESHLETSLLYSSHFL